MKTFEQFRRELADVTHMAIHSGRRIGVPGAKGCGCPLGVHPTYLTPSWPSPTDAASVWGISRDTAASFMNGFDSPCGDVEAWYVERPHPDALELGRLYRTRFAPKDGGSDG